MNREKSAPSLLQLPDLCLLAVLQHLAAHDQRGLCSAARSHSKLHQAAVAVLHNIKAVTSHVDSVLTYLTKHSEKVHGVNLSVNSGVDQQHCMHGR
jgi:hypothetical protein